jgi:hypothetical protein
VNAAVTSVAAETSGTTTDSKRSGSQGLDIEVITVELMLEELVVIIVTYDLVLDGIARWNKD